MYHYDPSTALEELSEEAILPNPVRVRDMILRKRHIRNFSERHRSWEKKF